VSKVRDLIATSWLTATVDWKSGAMLAETVTRPNLDEAMTDLLNHR
jgi:hypothetical protein